jgi:gliding motility-associated protein GldM
MKTIAKIITLFIVILFNCQLYAQTDNMAVVSADKMNVLYIGIDNPVSIAVSGITSDKLQVTINNGTITGSNGKYIARVEKVMETIIDVTAEIKPGEIKKVGSSTFRIKRIPDPMPCIGNNCNDKFFLGKEDLLRDPQLNVSMNLPFDFTFEIVSFSLTYYIGKNLVTETSIDNKFNERMIEGIKKLAIGSKVYIEDIKVKGPDGTTRFLGSRVIKLCE